VTAGLDYPGVDIPPGHCGTCGRPGHAFCDVPQGGVGGVEKAVRLVQLAMTDAEVIARTGVAEPVLAAIRATPVPPQTYQAPRRRPVRAPAAVQRRSPSEQAAFDAAQVALDEGGTPDAAEHAYWLTDELRRLRVREDARRIHAEQSGGPAPSFDAGSLAEILARPAEPAFRVERLIPAQASTLLVAQRKAGKTTATLNLARALLTGADFLGEFPVLPVSGDVALLNFEVSAHTIARWADEHGLPPERFHLVNLRGRRNPFAHDQDRAALAAWLKGRAVEAVIVDPFGRAYQGASQNDSGEVGAWLVALDTFARGEARDLILTAHAGWDGERTRGSSALEDWADTIITLTRGKDDDADGRYLRAVGRDVDVEEDRLDFDPASRTLTRSGTGSRKAAQRARAVAAARSAVLVYVRANSGCSGQVIRGNVDGGNAVVDAARRALVAEGALVEVVRKGRGGGSAYHVAEPIEGTPPTPPNPAPARFGTPPTPSL
jgi:hypothetical protein